MIRVKIRYEDKNDGDGGAGIRKVLRFDESIEYSVLIRKIIDKLGISIDHDDIDDINTSFQLRLGGDSIIEDTSEIEHGDDLVLVRISTANNNGEAVVKKEAALKAKENNKDSADMLADVVKEEDHEVISISSDDDEDDDESWELDDDEDDSTATSVDDDDDDDYIDHSQQSSNKKRQRTSSVSKKNKKKVPLEPPLEVIMNQKDIPSAPGKNNDDDDDDDVNSIDKNNIGFEEALLLVDKTGKKKADRLVKDRIIKLLNTGFHDKSNENEAKNAMKLAHRLMRKHNLSQAMLLKERKDKINNTNPQDDDEVLKGGIVRVTILNRKTRKPSLYARWIARLVMPVCDNFEVKSYRTLRRSVRCDVSFYGIHSNAQLAAYAFKVAVERISQMTAEYDPSATMTTGGGKRRKHNCNNTISTKSSRLSYALGIVRGISKDVQLNINLEKEERKRKLERAQSAQKRGEAYEDSDDDDNDAKTGGGWTFSTNGDSDNNNTNNDSQHIETMISGINLDRRVEELEHQQQAALVLINHNEKIAEEVLKEHGIKFSTRSRRKRAAIVFDPDSYEKGIEDSKEIDMNQRAIRDEIKVKKERL